MLIQPIEVWTEVGSSATDGIEVNGLAGKVRLSLLHFRVEIEDMHTFWPLAFEDRADLRLEEAQLPRIDGTGTIDSDRDFPDALAHDSRQIEPGPDVAPVLDKRVRENLCRMGDFKRFK
jgi:hypothetical protein